jgi:hypothetical protein
MSKKKNNSLKILLLDIETSPLISYTWGLFDQNVALNQVKEDWHVLSWSARWYTNESGKVFGPHNKVMYKDQRNVKPISNDKKLLEEIWKLLDEADVVLTQNGKKFDTKKLNARFVLNGMQPPSSFRQIDTLQIARKNFAFTSNKLEYMTDKLCTRYKKLKPKKFAGFELWKACMAGNKEAWREMEKYNKHDVLSLEELYHKLQAWDNTLNFNVYNDSEHNACSCGSTSFLKRGFAYTNNGKFQRLRCNSCGKETREKQNLLTPEKRKSLQPGTR